MLKVTRRTHLHSLTDRECNRGVIRLLCLLDGNTLVSTGRDGLIDVWDLSTQHWVRAFGANAHKCKVTALEFSAVPLVSSASATDIWRLDGTLLHQIDLGVSWIVGYISCGNHVFFYLTQELISVVDVLCGERVRERKQEWSSFTYYLGNMATKDKWLFVLVRANDEEDEETDASPTGIHVLNQSDLVKASLFLGNFMGMKC